jgi:hypothetical protein
LHPGLTFVQPVSGFQVDSVHSIAEFVATIYLAQPTSLAL